MANLQGFNNSLGAIVPTVHCALSQVGANSYETMFDDHQVGTSFPIYFLPSRADQITFYRIPNVMNGCIILTTQLSACSVYVTCQNRGNPLNYGNQTTLYHANAYQISVNPNFINHNHVMSERYKRELLMRCLLRNHHQLALELNRDHYLRKQPIRERSRKAWKLRYVTESRAQDTSMIGIRTGGLGGTWSFFYQTRVRMSYKRPESVFTSHFKFNGEKDRCHNLPVPIANDWGGAIP